MKTFIVELNFSDRNPKIVEVCANNSSDAIKIAKKDYREPICVNAKEAINCFVESAFGHIPIDVKPNPYYNNEIIINGKRFQLFNNISYWDITTICFNSVGNNSMGIIYTEKGDYLVKIVNTASFQYLEYWKKLTN